MNTHYIDQNIEFFKLDNILVQWNSNNGLYITILNTIVIRILSRLKNSIL